MWFLGLILGLIFGAISGGGGGAAAGAFFGSLAGWLLGKLMGGDQQSTARINPAVDDRLSALQRAIEDIHWRLQRLEKARGLSGSPMQDANGAATAPMLKAAAQTVQAADAPTTPVPLGTSAEPWGRDASPASLDVASPSGAASPSPNAIAADSLSAVKKDFANVVEAISTPTNDATGRIARAADAPHKSASPPLSNPPTPPAPNLLWAWFTGGNTIVRVGVLILFIGVAFLVKFAAEHSMFPMELRLAFVAAGAVALLVVGWRLRVKPEREIYALTLQGAGIAILYLTIFGAFRLYGLIPAGLAFPLLVGIAAFSALLAIRQNAMTLAVTGAAGGFLAPILASTGHGNHIALFSYYAVLNAGIFFTAWHKVWRPLNLIGFAFTFVIGALWGAKSYTPEFFATTEPFLVLFFVAYVAIAILYAFKQAPKLSHYVDGTLIFGVPIVAFGLQAGMVHRFEFGTAFSALALSAFYLGLATWLKRKQQPQLHLLVESFLALGVIFGSLAIPLALDARWTSAAWALEGAAVYWVGVRQDRKLARAFGLLLQVLAGLAFLQGWNSDLEGYVVINRQCIGALLLAGSGFFLNRLINRHAETVTKDESALSPLLFLWGLGWWLAAGFGEIERFRATNLDDMLCLQLAFVAVTAFLFSMASFRMSWREAAWPQRAFLPAMLLLAFAALTRYGHVFAHGGWIVWPLAIALHLVLMKVHEPEETEPPTLLRQYFAVLHTVTLLLIAVIGATEIHWLTGEFDLRHSAWSVAALMLVPCVLLLIVSLNRTQQTWPIRSFPQPYWQNAGVPIVIALCLWSLFANFSHDGQSLPLPYLPLLNAIDLGHLFALMTSIVWWRRVRELPGMASNAAVVRVIGSALGFIWLNAILLRTIHHWAYVPYHFESMMASVLVQTALSIFWTVIALSLMLFGARRAVRGVWIVGAALMAVVVGKLFFVDLSHLQGVERIVSFIGVGVLMLVIGYIAPVPPSIKPVESGEEETV